MVGKLELMGSQHAQGVQAMKVGQRVADSASYRARLSKPQQMQQEIVVLIMLLACRCVNRIYTAVTDLPKKGFKFAPQVTKEYEHVSMHGISSADSAQS